MDTTIAYQWGLPFICGVTIGTLVFALYVEFSSGMGNILIRPNDLGDNVFSLGGFINLMKEPLKNTAMWRPENLDINYIFVSLLSGSSGMMVQYVFNVL
jgi:hypothetical protein